MTRPEKWNWLHRDADGKPLLDGPNCDDCGRREVARYYCTACPTTWEIPGVLVWSWQGKGHYHKPDDEAEMTALLDHVTAHGPNAMALPSRT